MALHSGTCGPRDPFWMFSTFLSHPSFPKGHWARNAVVKELRGL